MNAVIVLGAAVAAPGVPGPAMVRRTLHAAEFFLAGEFGHLVVSGGQVGPPPAEAHLMRDLALGAGVPEARIIVEDASRNTFENALYCGLIIRERRWNRVTIVTDSFHLPRALFIFRYIGLRVQGERVPRPPTVTRTSWMRQHAEEAARCVNCAYHFAIGAHKPKLARVWGGQESRS